MSTTTQKTQTLSFYTLGEPFTELIRNFIEEGSFYQAYEILKDGGAPPEYIKSFFLFTSEFVGDTRDDSFAIRFCSPVYSTEERLYDIYFYALSTLMTQIYREEDLDPDDVGFSIHLLRKNKSFQCLLKVIPEEQIMDIIIPRSNLAEWYDISPSTKKGNQVSLNGVITTDGRLIGCGNQGHQEMYPYLYSLGLADARDWTNSYKTIHISSGQTSGSLAHAMEHPKDEMGNKPTEKQIATLFEYRDRIRSYGFGNNSIPNTLLEYNAGVTNKGGKFNNLTFLSKFYPEINLPKFSLNPMEGNVCIRTSPRYSMPGLLNSKFGINENSIKEIEEDFEKYRSLMGISDNPHYQNKLYYFYQEFIEGKNGVAHYRASNPEDWREREFSYSVSSNRGDIVDGVKSDELLSYKEGKELAEILETLSKDLNESIQVEFVISEEGKVYIVQLRILKDEPTYLPYQIDENKILYKGKSFSIGSGDFNIKDVLIIDNDSADSSILIGKKALIVREDVEFSHILALSKAMNIPSIYGVGDIKLPKKFSINTKGIKGLIIKKS